MKPASFTPIEAVAYDYGGVLIAPITDKFNRVADDLDQPRPAVIELLIGDYQTLSHPWCQLEIGAIDQAAYTTEVLTVAAEQGVPLTADHIGFLFDESQVVFVEEVVAHVLAVRRTGVRTALVTNLNPGHLEWIATQIDVGAMFDAVVDSSAEGVRKPDPAYFALLADGLGVAPERTLFVDDFAVNVDAARAVGFQTLHATAGVDLVGVVEALLLERSPSYAATRRR